MIDRVDVFIREAAAAMEAGKNNKYYRRILPEGFDGALLTSASIINDATVAIQQRVPAFNHSTAHFEKAISDMVGTLPDAASSMTGLAGARRRGRPRLRDGGRARSKPSPPRPRRPPRTSRPRSARCRPAPAMQDPILVAEVKAFPLVLVEEVKAFPLALHRGPLDRRQ